MEKTGYKNLIIKSIRLSRWFQNEDGSFPAGHNGPYHDPETPVRNTAHWTIANLYAWKATGEKSYKDTAVGGIRYLVEAVRASRPHGVVCRDKPGKDKINGLVGQAWIIEALAEAAWLTGDNEALEAAEELFRRHRFVDTACAWQTATDPTIGTVKFDRTLNHQLWFAASGALLVRSGVDARDHIEAFVDCHVRGMKQYSSGLIHHSNPYFITTEPKEKVKAFLRHFRVYVNRNKVYMKSVGYHTFNTYALALLEVCMPDLGLQELKKVKNAVRFITSDEFRKKIGESDYSFGYNPPGFEAEYTLKVFGGQVDSLSLSLIEEQVERTYNEESGHFNRKVWDPRTSAARVYEYARVLECGST